MKFRLMLTGMLVSSTLAFTSLFANINNVFAEKTEILGTGQCGEDVYWTLYSDGTLDLSGTGATYDYTMKKFSLVNDENKPDDGYKVTSKFGFPTWLDVIYEIDPFHEKFCIKSINVGEGITRLGDLIFEGVGIYDIDNLNLPNSLEEIGYFAFSNFKKGYGDTIKKLPDNLKVIESGGLCGIKFEDKVVLPESVEKIGSFAFNTYAKEYVIPQNVKEISPLAFGVTENEEYVDNNPIYDYYYEDNLEPIWKFVEVAIYRKDVDSVIDVFKADTGVTVYGYTDTAAETYANENNFEFVPLNEEPATTTSTVSTSTETTTNTVVEDTTTETSSEGTSQNTASSTSGTTTAVSTTSKKSSAKEDSPKTGDKGIIGIGAVLLSALGMFCISKKRQ